VDIMLIHPPPLWLEYETLCLYGLPNETWKVNVRPAKVPQQLPEPAEGINIPRDSMPKEDWLSFVAAHSDAWLVAMAFHFGALFGFDKDARSCHNFDSNVFNFFVKVYPLNFIFPCVQYICLPTGLFFFLKTSYGAS
jgi:hypothetical protein